MSVRRWGSSPTTSRSTTKLSLRPGSSIERPIMAAAGRVSRMNGYHIMMNGQPAGMFGFLAGSARCVSFPANRRHKKGRPGAPERPARRAEE